MVDLLRGCKTKTVYWDEARTLKSTIIWYWCAPGAGIFPGPNIFTSETWDETHWYGGPAGEDYATGAKFYDGVPPGVPNNDGPCGKLEWFANGCPSDAPPLPRNAAGLPLCCFDHLVPVGELCACSSGEAIPPGPVETVEGCTCSEALAYCAGFPSCSCSDGEAGLFGPWVDCSCSDATVAAAFWQVCSCSNMVAVVAAESECRFCTITPRQVTVKFHTANPAYAWLNQTLPCAQAAYPCGWRSADLYVPGYGDVYFKFYNYGGSYWGVTATSPGVFTYEMIIAEGAWDGTQPRVYVGGPAYNFTVYND